MYIEANLYEHGDKKNNHLLTLWAVALYIQIEVYALFINGENKIVLNSQWIVIIELSFKEDLTLS